MKGEGEGGGEGVPAEESIFVSVLNKIDEAYTWLKAKLKSLFTLFSESITEALLGLRSFVTSSCEKLREVLSGINARIDNLPENQVVEVVPEEGSLLGEMKMLVQKIRKQVDQWLEVGNASDTRVKGLTLKWFLDLVDGFIELLESAYKQPWILIHFLVEGYFIYRSCNKAGGVKKVSKHKGKAAMAIATLINLIFANRASLLV